MPRKIAHATLKGPSVVKETIIGLTLGFTACALWKVHQWQEERRTVLFYDRLKHADIGVGFEEE